MDFLSVFQAKEVTIEAVVTRTVSGRQRKYNIKALQYFDKNPIKVYLWRIGKLLRREIQPTGLQELSEWMNLGRLTRNLTEQEMDRNLIPLD